MTANILGAIGSVGMALLASDGGSINRSNSFGRPDAQIQFLAQEVAQEMSKYEQRLFLEADRNSCFALYGHWFLTLLAILEASLRLMLHFFIATIYCVSYYLVKCLSCGKAGFLSSFQAFGQFHINMSAVYFGLLCALPQNLIFPWDPPFYVFKRNPTLIRPPMVPPYSGLDLGGVLRNGCCVVCCGSCLPDVSLSPGNSLRFLLFAYGGTHAHCACLWGNEVPTVCGCGRSYNNYLQQTREEIRRTSAAETAIFYQTTYQVESFDELVARRMSQQQQQQQQQSVPYVVGSPVISPLPPGTQYQRPPVGTGYPPVVQAYPVSYS